MGFTTKVRMTHRSASNYSTEMQAYTPHSNPDLTVHMATAQSRWKEHGVGLHRVGAGQFITQCPRCGADLEFPFIEKLYSSTPNTVGGFFCSNTACRYLQPLFMEVVETDSSSVTYKDYQLFQESVREARTSITSELEERMNNPAWRTKMFEIAMPRIESGSQCIYVEETIEFIHWGGEQQVSVEMLDQKVTSLSVVWPVIVTLKLPPHPIAKHLLNFSVRLPHPDGRPFTLFYDHALS